jgi:hypothetical protein
VALAVTPRPTGADAPVSGAEQQRTGTTYPASASDSPHVIAEGGRTHVPPTAPVPAVVLGARLASGNEHLPTDRLRVGYGDDDVFSDFGDLSREHGRSVKLLTTVSPAKRKKTGGRLIRYDLLAGAALVLALLAMVPLLLLRGDPEEISTAPQVPAAGGGAGDIEVVLAQPVDITDKVRLDWTATGDFDFGVAVAVEGEKAEVLLVGRVHTKTLDVEPGRRYCFQIQATDGDGVYKSEPVALRGATCRE